MPGERFINPDTYREAYKINKLVDEHKVSSSEASQATRQDIADMVTKIFDRQFSQNYHNPAEMRAKTMGQKAEDILVNLLNFIPIFHARHGTDREDAVNKTDLALSLAGNTREIPIQLATYTDPERLALKKTKLPKDVVLVVLPMGNIFRAFEKPDLNLLKKVIDDFVQQVLKAIENMPEYFPLYEKLHQLQIQDQLAGA